MKIVCTSLLISQVIISSLAAPVTTQKEAVNASTAVEDEVTQLHTLIKSGSADKNDSRGERSRHSDEKKLLFQGIPKTASHSTKELLDPLPPSPKIPNGSERAAAEIVKRGIPRMMKQREIIKGLYRDFSSEDGNDYDRGEEWLFDTPEDTSRDMAEYIFWTGDEVSVTQAIKDFLKQGLLSQSEAISFLEGVRSHLKKMQIRYGVADNVALIEEPKPIVDYSEEETIRLPPQPAFRDVASDVAERQLIPGRSLDEDVESSNFRDVLYEMGKIFFKQSIVKDGPRDTEEALHNLATYLDSETDMGRISDATKAQILEVLFASLVDAMNDNSDIDHSKIKSIGRQE